MPGDYTAARLDSYIDVPDAERADVAARIDETAVYCASLGANISYPSDAMAQVLIGDFTGRDWTRFKTATDIYCERDRLARGSHYPGYGTENKDVTMFWQFDLYYPTCIQDKTMDIWTCTNSYCTDRPTF